MYFKSICNGRYFLLRTEFKFSILESNQFVTGDITSSASERSYNSQYWKLWYHYCFFWPWSTCSWEILIMFFKFCISNQFITVDISSPERSFTTFSASDDTPTSVTHQSVGNMDDFVVKHFWWNGSQLGIFHVCKSCENEVILRVIFVLVKKVYKNNAPKILKIVVFKIIFTLKIPFNLSFSLGSSVGVFFPLMVFFRKCTTFVLKNW